MLVNSAVITGKGADTAKGRSPQEISQIRELLKARYDDLNTEYEEAVAENQRLRLVEIGDAAGDDQADSGSKTADRDAATTLAVEQFTYAYDIVEQGTQSIEALAAILLGGPMWFFWWD
jgi:hypothetical protein